MYLAMEQWFHDFNPKDEVEDAHKKIAEVLRLMKEVFPRDEGQGWNIPKHHGMTKMQYYMMLFGSGINFFGGPGESHHKWFVKYPGNNTQRRVREFAKQVANRMYEAMILNAGRNAMRKEDDKEYERVEMHHENEIEEQVLYGRYYLEITSVRKGHCSSNLQWASKNKRKSATGKHSLREDLLEIIYDEVRSRKLTLPYMLTGFTEMKSKRLSGVTKTIYRASPYYKGKSWYDWAFVLYREKVSGRVQDTHYPSLILGYIDLPNQNGTGGTSSFAAVRSSIKPVKWETIKKEFVHEFKLSRDYKKNHTLVPVSSIDHPIIVVSDHEGPPDKFFAVLPKRNWSDYFSNLIK